MKKLIVAFIILLAAVWLGIIMHKYPGFVLISMGHTRIEMTVWFAIIALVVLFFALRLLIAIFKGVFNVSKRYSHWSAERHEASAQQHMQDAVFYLSRDDFKTAEKDFVKSAKLSKSKLLNYLGAAKAAQSAEQFEQRDQYLAKAKKIAGREQAKSIDLIKARWEVATQQWGAALATLKTLPSQDPFVLKMYHQIYVAQENWERLKLLLPQLKQKHVLNSSDLEALQEKISLVFLQKALMANHASEIEQIWVDLPKKLKKQPAFLSIYVEYLIKHNEHIEAEQLLSDALKHHLDPKLLNQYASVVSNNPTKQLAKAESWLAEHPENPDLLYCLGKLCVQYRLWGKAKTYFDTSIKIQPQKQTYQALGSVLEHLNENSAALVCYREGLMQQ